MKTLIALIRREPVRTAYLALIILAGVAQIIAGQPVDWNEAAAAALAVLTGEAARAAVTPTTKIAVAGLTPSLGQQLVALGQRLQSGATVQKPGPLSARIASIETKIDALSATAIAADAAARRITTQIGPPQQSATRPAPPAPPVPAPPADGGGSAPPAPVG